MNIDGHPVSGILVTEARNILHEYYLSISVDRTSRDYDVLATASGGTEVETIAREHPESVRRLHIGPLEDFDRQAARTMAERIGFYHADLEQATQILLGMWHTFQDSDATLVEINPLAKVGDPDDEATKHLDALDAKISLDGNAAFRHDGWKRFTDPAQVDQGRRPALRPSGRPGRRHRQRRRTGHELLGCRGWVRTSAGRSYWTRELP